MNEAISKRRKRLYRDLVFIAISILFGIYIYQANYLAEYILSLSGFYFGIGAFIAGVLFSSTFTAPVAFSTFLVLSADHNPLSIALFGSLGAFVGNSLIFKFLKDDLLDDFEYIEGLFPKKKAQRILHSKLIFWFVPILAALLIASPLPDELGLILLAGVMTKYHHFSILVFALNFVGILLIALFGRII